MTHRCPTSVDLIGPQRILDDIEDGLIVANGG